MPWFYTRLQNWSNQNSMGLAQKQTHTWVEQKYSRNKHMHIWSIIFDERDKNIQLGKDNISNKYCWKNWTATYKTIKLDLFLTPHPNLKSKWIKDLIVKFWNCKTPRRKHRQEAPILVLAMFFGHISLGNNDKSKDKEMALHQINRLLHNEYSH